MSLAEANLSLPENFTGIARIFPLPNLVLFPGVIQPLHIFEPRYRKLVEDAIAGDELIAMAMLKNGWQMSDYSSESGNPPIHRTLCVGKIVTHARLDDGRYNLLLLGAKRASIVREIPTNNPYRMAEVNLLESPENNDSQIYHGPIRSHVVKLFRQIIAKDNQLDEESVECLLSDELPFGLLLDLIAFSAGADLAIQQQILETIDVLARANSLIEILEARLQQHDRQIVSRFPPEFSYN